MNFSSLSTSRSTAELMCFFTTMKTVGHLTAFMAGGSSFSKSQTEFLLLYILASGHLKWTAYQVERAVPPCAYVDVSLILFRPSCFLIKCSFFLEITQTDFPNRVLAKRRQSHHQPGIDGLMFSITNSDQNKHKSTYSQGGAELAPI